MKVFVTGGTGFVGQEVIRQLVAAGHQVVALVRTGSEKKLAPVPEVKLQPGDVLQPDTLQEGLKGCDAVIHLVGIIREFPGKGITFGKLHTEATRQVIKAAQNQGVQRYLQMSANGSRPNAATEYHKTKWAAEESVRNCSLDWTIFRPSLIFGPGDQFVNTLADLIRKFPVIPVIGNGRYKMTPVAVENVAAGFVAALERPDSTGQTYHCGGPQDLSYDEILDHIGRALGKTRVAKLHQPLLLMKPAIQMLQSIQQFPITSDQLTMLLEGNSCDPTFWAETFKLELTPFYPGIRSYLQSTSAA